MATTLNKLTESRTPSGNTPPLENGDHLTREEFYRRWESMPELKNAERIEGVVHMPAAVRFQQHGRPHADLMGWLWVYRSATAGVELGDNTTLQLDMDNDPQPDAFLRIAPECRGQSRTNEDGYVVGAPELIGEIAASSASFDLHEKLTVYRRNAVREYLVWKVLDDEVVWFELKDGQYVAKAADEEGIFKSRVFPGLWLNTGALLGGEMAAVLQTLQEGLATDEHAAFVETLKKAGSDGA